MSRKLVEWLDGAKGLLRSGCRVLLVDDEEYARVAVQLALQKLEVKVTAVSTGLEALELLGKEVPDVIILDLKMPFMNGPELLKNIRRILPSIPVVVLTGYPRGALVEEVLKYPPVTIVSKTPQAECVWQ